ncbi:carbohydrate kinase family protein [Pseudoduganella sp. GCM10020061]|uniref:carbohydrate kinase family protein n=1 Tax=Pseudoduganella sp. GCM10020061 TaxID=3317345 RepID=UPI00363C6E5F
MTLATTGRVVCIGAANIDRKLTAKGPLHMGTSNPVRQHESFGGVARNVAENLAHLGVAVSLVTAVGNDAAGRALLAHAVASGIDVAGSITLDGDASGTYTAILDERGGMALALADMELYEQLVPDIVLPLAAPAALTVADLNLPQETLAALLEQVHPLVIVAVSEPKMARLPRNLEGLRLLILNLGEMEARLRRRIDGDTSLADACREVQSQGVRDVIVTRGSSGVTYTTAGGIDHLTASPVQVVDVTGAGDAFAAAVCWSLLDDPDDLALACRRGMHLAGLTVGSPLTVLPANARIHAGPAPDGFPPSRE